ncbi:hypothetical protein OJ253_3479 [Cryptosporidium canis]|uniref:Uncharacterized protein n=1 Tax=Cryptosporidium canis TaxID=195482 RepID=A0A9D5DJP2_9CRYT|nr:hypothetical protein OJ253_3479 [Cryptosporidium canis]
MSPYLFLCMAIPLLLNLISNVGFNQTSGMSVKLGVSLVKLSSTPSRRRNRAIRRRNDGGDSFEDDDEGPPNFVPPPPPRKDSQSGNHHTTSTGKKPVPLPRGIPRADSSSPDRPTVPPRNSSNNGLDGSGSSPVPTPRSKIPCKPPVPAPRGRSVSHKGENSGGDSSYISHIIDDDNGPDGNPGRPFSVTKLKNPPAPPPRSSSLQTNEH